MSKETTEVFKILQKYMKHVEECEGVTFVDYLNHKEMSSIEFTPFELNFLKTVEAQIRKDDCLCEYKRLNDGSMIKVASCDFHK